jgi:hypothetical protein
MSSRLAPLCVPKGLTAAHADLEWTVIDPLQPLATVRFWEGPSLMFEGTRYWRRARLAHDRPRWRTGTVAGCWGLGLTHWLVVVVRARRSRLPYVRNPSLDIAGERAMCYDRRPKFKRGN